MDGFQLRRQCRIRELDSLTSRSMLMRSKVLCMRKRIKVTGFKDWDSMFYNNLLSIPVLLVASLIIENWGADSFARNLWVFTVSSASRLISDTAPS